MIDLLVAIGIIVLLSTITIPYLRKYQPNLKLRVASRNLTGDIRYAQQLTITEQKTHIVSLDIAGGKYEILRIDSATTTVKTVNFDSEIFLKQITGLTGNNILFNFYGAVSRSGTIILSNLNNNESTINIKPSGFVELVE